MNTAQPKVLLLGTKAALKIAFPQPLLDELGGRVQILTPMLTAANCRDHPDLLAQADFILGTWGVPRLDSEFLDLTPRLKALFYAAGSVKEFATPEFFARGLSLSNAHLANAIPVAEYATAAIILSLKKFWQHSRQTKVTRTWKRLDVPGAWRSVVGLVSLGAVGQATARLLQNYDLKILSFDPLTTEEQAQSLGVQLCSLEELFRSSDVVSLHAPWLPETENLVGGTLLRLMKPEATLLNTSRGAVINEPELCQVLQERPDLTAILDVTRPEPPAADSPLFTLDNVILTPHISGSMGAEVARMGQWMADELIRHLDGLPLKHQRTEAELTTAA